MRPFWIDTDMGSDDAVALIMAFRANDVEVVGLSAVAGNVPMEQAAKNARFVSELCDSAAPVHRGASHPLRRPLETGEWFHGHDGLSGCGGEPAVPPVGSGTDSHSAAAAISKASRDHDGMVLVTLGPLTNIALALQADPDLAGRVSRCVVMGGAACTYGNVTPAAEYNIWVDPDAAREVFLSGLPVEMVGWEFCQGEFGLNAEEISRLAASDSPLAAFALDSNRTAMNAYYEQTGERLLSLPDPVTMAVAIDPSIATATSRHFVEIETESELTRGMTVVDKLDVAMDRRNAETWSEAIAAGKKVLVAWQIHSRRWKEMLFVALG